MRRAPLLILLLAGCASHAGRAEPAREVEAFGLPAVRAPLEFPPGTTEITLAWALGELARLSGQELSMLPQVRTALESSKEPLEILAPVPAAEVYPFVEGLLVNQGFLIMPLKGGSRPVLGVFLPGGGRNPLDAGQPVIVSREELPELARHPALLCQLVLSFENIDSRQLQTQLRQLLVDASGVQQVVPGGDRCLLLQGYGAKILGLAQTLTEVDRMSAERPRAEAPAPASAAK